MRVPAIIGVTAAAAGLLWLGTLIAGSRTVYVPTPSSAPAVMQVVPARGPSQLGGLTREELRAILREEFAVMEAAAPAVARAIEPDSDVAATPAQQVAADRASALLDHALSAGRFTAEDATSWRTLMPQLPEAVIGEFLGRFTRAVNAQQLDVQAMP